MIGALLVQLAVPHRAAAANSDALLGADTISGRPTVGVATPGADALIGGELLDDGLMSRGQLVHDTGYDGTGWGWAQGRYPDVALWAEGHGQIVFQEWGYLATWPAPLDPTNGSQSVRWEFDTVGAFYETWKWDDIDNVKRCHNGLGGTIYPTGTGTSSVAW